MNRRHFVGTVAAISAAFNLARPSRAATHSAEARLCRWILQVRDRIDGNVIELTQDFLAQMLAVRRPTVTLIAQKLQNAGLIRYRRGRIVITDHEGLEERACECVREIRNKTRQILGELG